MPKTTTTTPERTGIFRTMIEMARTSFHFDTRIPKPQTIKKQAPRNVLHGFKLKEKCAAHSTSLHTQGSLFFLTECYLRTQKSSSECPQGYVGMLLIHQELSTNPHGAPCPHRSHPSLPTASLPPRSLTPARAEDAPAQPWFIVMETRSLFLSKPSLMAWIKISVPLGRAPRCPKPILCPPRTSSWQMRTSLQAHPKLVPISISLPHALCPPAGRRFVPTTTRT